MDHEEVGRFWNTNANAWTTLARAGYDVYRDYLNTPAFFAMLPDVAGLSGWILAVEKATTRDCWPNVAPV
jgi:hypothetical protein